MTTPVGTYEIAHMTNAALCRFLEEAEQEEHELSSRRHELHDRMDSGSHDAEADALTLAEEERELSTLRLELHQRITELRLEKGRRLNGLRAPLTVVPNDARP